MHSQEPPVIDFALYYGTDAIAKEKLVQQILDACEQYGFSQLINHNIPAGLQKEVIQQSKDFFSLPVDIKEKYDKDLDGFQRGYERLRSQNFEKRDKGDLKEGFYLGKNLALDDPQVLARRVGQGPNKYPTEVKDPSAFQWTMEQYHSVMTDLAIDILRVRLAHSTLMRISSADSANGLWPRSVYFIIRLKIQPRQKQIEDEVGGLQVWNNLSSEWVDVTPIPGACVVNLGNMMMQWTNDRYLSNLHRVVNRSGRERYSVPFFFSGNPNYVIECLPNCLKLGQKANYAPVSLHDWILGRYANTYTISNAKAITDLRHHVVGVVDGK